MKLNRTPRTPARPVGPLAQTATPTQPTIEPGFTETRINTWFTAVEPSGKLWYSAEQWVRLRLTLETAGPVAVSAQQNLGPVLSGKGRLLPTGQEVEIVMGKGNRLYYASSGVNRVAVVVEPIPWLERIAGEITSAAGGIVSGMAAVLDRIRSGGSSEPPKPPPCPPPRNIRLPRR